MVFGKWSLVGYTQRDDDHAKDIKQSLVFGYWSLVGYTQRADDHAKDMQQSLVQKLNTTLVSG